MVNHIRIPKPSYLLSQLSPRKKPDALLFEVLHQVAGQYGLGQFQDCYQAPRSKSKNFIVTTSQGKFVFREQHLSEDDIAYEYQVITHLRQHDFPVPAMLADHNGRPWVIIDNRLYSVYRFVSGYNPGNFLWLPAVRRKIIVQCGRTLGKFHQATVGLEPAAYKWNAYKPGVKERWQEGGWFLQALKKIRSLLQKAEFDSPLDHFVLAHLDAFEQMLRLEPVIEERSELSKFVVHGDYSPWNVFFRLNQPPIVLDFNESRLELKIYDIMLAVFWFSWRNNCLNQDRSQAFLEGYYQTNYLNKVDIELAGSIFQWIMARSIVERLHKHYFLKKHSLAKSVAGLERQYQMCLFAKEYSQQLVIKNKARAS